MLIFMNQIYMLSPLIQRLHNKFQPNWLKNAKVMHVYHFQAGRLVGLDRSLQKHNFPPNMKQIGQGVKKFAHFTSVDNDNDDDNDDDKDDDKDDDVTHRPCFSPRWNGIPWRTKKENGDQQMDRQS